MNHNATVLVHVGKCGGGSLKAGISNEKYNADVQIVHIEKPIYRADLQYIIVARSPLARLLSAFRWRYKLVVTQGTQRNRFKGEHEVLSKYGRLNNIAEALYFKNGDPNPVAHQEIRRIHHIREDISFYLTDLLAQCQPQQIVAVLMQESLDDDIFQVFGYRNECQDHINPPADQENNLSPAGIVHLMRFFHQDYEALTRLYCWGKIQHNVFLSAMSHPLYS